jgi:hypothetical protein
MSNFQRRHYEAIAAVMAYSDAPNRVVDMMVSLFERDNQNFDRSRFKGRIAGLKSPSN